MNTPAFENDLLDHIRRLGACECAAVGAATNALSEREKAILAAQLSKVATHLATRAGSSVGLPPPGTTPGAGIDRIDLSAQWTALPVARIFVHNTLIRWQWGDVLIDGECAVQELITAFVAAVEACPLGYPTRMTLRLRVLSAARLVVELHDSPENAQVIIDSGRLITECVERISVRCGRHSAGGRTVLWAELGRPEVSTRWA
ncbi:hypothetical protein BJY24_003048 [Nocardia transvalensis]|uniref:Uncharacterized protein n=1 Tax=Nocardia transvalensis TaxID=37333 RepID=A0A7W9PDZ0_9NOCA|nr:hypothetical protein [Nocardia transvalensis]MBB5914181.1 hypothetical protein [Nocardia transvalensis]